MEASGNTIVLFCFSFWWYSVSTKAYGVNGQEVKLDGLKTKRQTEALVGPYDSLIQETIREERISTNWLAGFLKLTFTSRCFRFLPSFTSCWRAHLHTSSKSASQPKAQLPCVSPLKFWANYQGEEAGRREELIHHSKGKTQFPSLVLDTAPFLS